jgi:hypothetical protein
MFALLGRIQWLDLKLWPSEISWELVLLEIGAWSEISWNLALDIPFLPMASQLGQSTYLKVAANAIWHSGPDDGAARDVGMAQLHSKTQKFKIQYLLSRITKDP